MMMMMFLFLLLLSITSVAVDQELKMPNEIELLITAVNLSHINSLLFRHFLTFVIEVFTCTKIDCSHCNASNLFARLSNYIFYRECRYKIFNSFRIELRAIGEPELTGERIIGSVAYHL